MVISAIWILIALVLWLAAGLAVAWLFGGACRLGGPEDPRASSSRRHTPALRGQGDEQVSRARPARARSAELGAKAK